MSLFFINQATYLEVSRPISCLQLDVKKSGTFPAFQETKAITNSELDAENSQNRFPKCMSNINTLMCTFLVSR